jgi:hypothetical protein
MTRDAKNTGTYAEMPMPFGAGSENRFATRAARLRPDASYTGSACNRMQPPVKNLSRLAPTVMAMAAAACPALVIIKVSMTYMIYIE